jgi:hypothetical protein
MRYHAVMLDETGCEFGVDIEADSRDEAYDRLAEDYPESQCVQLESPQDAADREAQWVLAEEEDDFWDDFWEE